MEVTVQISYCTGCKERLGAFTGHTVNLYIQNTKYVQQNTAFHNGGNTHYFKCYNLDTKISLGLRGIIRIQRCPENLPIKENYNYIIRNKT